MPIDPADLGISDALALAATYTREVGVGVDRIWENVLDWEHLPALYEIFFDHVRLVETGSLGWRVELSKTHGSAGRWMLLELRIDFAPAPVVVVDPVTGEVTLNAGRACRFARRGERAIVSPRSPGPRHRERRPAPEPR